MFKVNDRYFHNLYDASKYVMKLAAEGKPVEIREAERSEAVLSKLRA